MGASTSSSTSTDPGGNFRLGPAVPLVTERAWKTPANYRFLDGVLAPAVPGGYVEADGDKMSDGALGASQLQADLQRTLTADMSRAQSLVTKLGIQQDGGVPSMARGPWVATREVVTGYSPGPEVVYGPTSMTQATPNPDLTKVMVNPWNWSVTSPGHYVFYYRNLVPSGVPLPLGAVFRGPDIQPGPGFYVKIRNTITVYGYVVFAGAMTSSTVFTKWYLPPGVALVPGTVNVTLDPGTTCVENSATCNNVSDFYRIEVDEVRASKYPLSFISANINDKQFTVTRNRAIAPGAANSNGSLAVFVNFKLTGDVVVA